MRALFVTFPWKSHFYALVPFATALRAAGHEVLVACQPDFAGTVTGAGLAALPVGVDVDVRGRATEAFAGWNPTVRAEGEAATSVRHRADAYSRLAVDTAVAMSKDLFRFARTWQPDVVGYEPTAVIGPGLAGELDVPSLRMLWGLDYVASVVRRRREMLTGDGSVDIDKAFGDVTFDPCPPSLQIDHPLRRQPVRYVPYNGPAILPHHLRTPSERRRVLVTWGGSLHDLGWADGILGPQFVAALTRRPGYEVVVAASDGQVGLYADLAGEVVHLGPVALNLVLPSCVAIVHQGGAGTTMTAMSAGVPQLIVPWAPDAIVNAEQISRAGAGRHLRPDGLDADAVDDAVGSFLGGLDTFRSGARRLHDEHLARPTPARLAIELAQQHLDGTGPWRPATAVPA